MTNVYRIGVQIAMASNGAQLLGVLSRHLTGVHGQVKGLEGGFNKLKLAIGGALAVGAGVGIISMFKGPLDEARKFEMAVGRFSRFGLGEERTREAAEFAKAMNIAGSTYVENMNRMAEAQGVFRDSGLSGDAALRGAKMAAPTLAKIDFANRGLDADTQAKFHGQTMDMMRFIEQRGGLNSPERFNQIADAGFKAITSSGGNVNWSLYRQFMATAGVAGRSMSDQALFGELEPIIGELKSRAGTGYMTAYSTFGGLLKPTHQRAAEALKLNLWNGTDIRMTPEGAKIISGRDPKVDPELFARSQFEYYEKYVRPAYDRAGYGQTQRDRSNVLLAGRTGGAEWSLYDRQSVVMNKSVDAQRVAMGIDAAYGKAGGTLNGRIIDMHAKFANLMERLGEAILPMAVKGLEVLVPAISKLTGWVGAHPGAVSIFAKSAITLGVALVGLGSLAVIVAAGAAIFAAGPVAVLAAGITATVSVVGSLIALNWGSLAKGFKMLYDQFAFMAMHPIKFLMGERPDDGSHPARKGGHYEQKMDWQRGVAINTWVPDRPSAAPRGAGGGKPLQVTTNLIVDGKKMATVVSNYMAGALSGNFAATGRFDPSATLASPAAGYHR